jgi:hypothetical protein
MQRFILIVLVLLLLAVPGFAQELEPVDLGDGFSISVPDNWESESDRDSGGMLFTGRIRRDDLNLLVVTPPQVAELVEVSEGDLTDVLIEVIDEIYNADARSRDIDEVDDFDYPAVVWSYSTDDDLSGFAYLLEIDTEQYAFLDIWGENFEDHQDVVNEIIASFRFDADVATDPEADPEPAEPCFVSTDQARTVQIRVGPGENRSVILFLPTERSFTVTGRFEDTNGNVWFQLDKSEVDPNSAANEMWVAEAAVETEGDCENIAGADAPPVIPGGPRNPPGGGGNSGGGSSGGGDAAVGGVPNAGRWSIVLASTTAVSCTDTQTISVNTTEIFGLTVINTSISVAGDQRSITVGGSRFTLLQPGSYNGSFPFADGSNVQMRLDVQNGNLVTGQITYNYTVQGLNCSATVPITGTRS